MTTSSYDAVIRYAGDDYFIATPPSGNAIIIDVAGQRSAAASPLELLLVSVAACTAADVVSILEKKRQDVTEYRVNIKGQRKEDHPRAFVGFAIHHIVQGRGVSEKAVADAVKLSDEKYCSVAATVRPTAAITTTYEIVETGESNFA